MKPRRSWRTMFVQLRAVMQKEFRQTFRDRRMTISLFVIPVIQLMIFGFAVDFDVDDVPTVVVDEDRSSLSRAAVEALLADGTLSYAGHTDAAGADRALEDNTAAAAILIPPGLSEAVDGGRVAQAQVLLDGSDPMRSNVVASAAARYFAARAAPVRGPSISLDPRVMFNPTLKTAVYMVPGTAAMQLLMATTVLTAMGLAREKELGTLEQVQVTPIPTGVLMLGKVLPFLGIGFINMGAALLVGALIFGVPLHGSWTFLAAAVFAYVLSTLGAGLFISTISGSQQQAFMGGFFFMMPAMLLSGNMTPISAMPDWLRPVTLLNPMRYFIAIIRALLLRDAGWVDLWPQLVALLGFGVVILGLSASRFRKTLG